MANDDFAIVVGVRRYPRIKPPVPGNPHDLEGPDQDATDVYNWLTDPRKGAVPGNQALRVRSQDFPNPFLSVDRAQPDERDLEGAFRWLLTKMRPDGRIGRRLYLYFSGHGFGTERNNGGIYTATADPIARDHFYASGWFKWFYDAAFFKEYVLWFDACMTKIFVPAPRLPSLAPQIHPDAADAQVFTVFAARHPRKAVERIMPDGKVHGIFTHTLLKGLNGEAADPVSKDIDTQSLRKYLREHMRLWMSEEDIADPDVSNEPDFGPTDHIVFGHFTRSQWQIRFMFPQSAEGSRVRVEFGPFVEVASGTVQNGTWQTPLDNGIYRLVVEATNDTHKFEVKSDQDGIIDFR